MNVPLDTPWKFSTKDKGAALTLLRAMTDSNVDGAYRAINIVNGKVGGEIYLKYRPDDNGAVHSIGLPQYAICTYPVLEVELTYTFGLPRYPFGTVFEHMDLGGRVMLVGYSLQHTIQVHLIDLGTGTPLNGNICEVTKGTLPTPTDMDHLFGGKFNSYKKV